jgi:hypothetical protein
MVNPSHTSVFLRSSSGPTEVQVSTAEEADIYTVVTVVRRILSRNVAVSIARDGYCKC